jgi:ABC-type transport system involved in cytochrome bd biosynthesis fused ATPase/permease subunit
VDYSIFKEFGLVGLMIGAISTLLFIIVKWTLATTRDILNQAAKEREAFMQCQASWIKAIDDQTAQGRAFHDEVKEAHSFQRQEHKEMIVALGRINGYKT